MLLSVLVPEFVSARRFEPQQSGFRIVWAGGGTQPVGSLAHVNLLIQRGEWRSHVTISPAVVCMALMIRKGHLESQVLSRVRGGVCPAAFTRVLPVL